MSTLDYKYIANLVLRAQLGDSDAFAELYAATYQKQYTYALKYLKEEYLAQDALQETYIIALKNIDKLKNPSLVIAWLNQINFRVCYNLHRQQQLHYNEMTEFNLDNLEILSMDSMSPEDTVVSIDSREYIINQITKLPLIESQVIILKFYQNMTIDEIANIMDISRSSVKRYLARGKSRLGKILQD